MPGLQVLNIVVLIILGLFLRSYLPSYFGKKRENRASKEDMGEISSIDESVRSAIAEIKVGRDEYSREQRSSLLKFYDLSVELYYEKLAVDFGDFTMEERGKSLVIFEKSFYETISNLLKSYQRIVIYFDDKANVRVNAEKLLIQILRARSVMKKHFGKVKISFVEMSNNFDVAEPAFRQANREYWDSMNPVMVELFDALRGYLTALNEFLRPGELPRIPIGLSDE